MAKRVRDGQAPSFEQQLKAFKPFKVNPFTKMMDAAKTAYDQLPAPTTSSLMQQQQHHQQQQAASMSQNIALQQENYGVPCTHCGCALSELAVQQCHACKNVYCSSCSVVNYDAREDRVFCLDCHPTAVSTCCSFDDDCDMLYDSYNTSPHDRNITGCGSSRSSSMMRACSRAAAAAAASAAQDSSTPFGSVMSSSFAGSSALGFGGVAGAAWDISGSPNSLGAGQLLATSPVIPFVGLGCNQGYVGLANRVCGAAAVSGC